MRDTQPNHGDGTPRRGPHHAAFLRHCLRRLETIDAKLAYWQGQRRFMVRELRRIERLSADRDQ